MAKTLREFAEGSIIKLEENGALVEYVIAKHDYESGLNGTGRTLLARKSSIGTGAWNSTGVNTYADSSIDNFLNNDAKARFNADTQRAMGETSFYYTPMGGDTAVSTLKRSIFAASLAELGLTNTNSNAEGSELPVASTLKGLGVVQWTRTPNKSGASNVFSVSASGTVNNGAATATSTNYVLVTTLPSDATFLTDDGNISHYVLADISGEDAHLGDKDIPFTLEYTVSCTHDYEITVTEVLDGVLQLRRYTAEPDVIQTAEVTAQGLSQGDHTLSIEATAAGATAKRTYTFTIPHAYLSITDEDIGEKGEKFTVPYMAKTYTGTDLSVTEKVDGEVMRTYIAVSGEAQEMTVNTEFLSDTKHKAEITVEGDGETKTAVLTFSVKAIALSGGGSVQELQGFDGNPVYPATIAKAVMRANGKSVEESLAAADKIMDVSDVCIEKIISSCTWIVPKAVGQKFKVYCVGGGGGGATGSGSVNAGSGGGGGYVAVADLVLAEGEEIDILCGVGGLAANGGSSAFGTYVVASGGECGVTNGKGGNGGAGGGGAGCLAGNGGNGDLFGGGGAGSGINGSYYVAGADRVGRGGNGGTYGGGGGGSMYFVAANDPRIGEGGNGGDGYGDGGNSGNRSSVSADGNSSEKRHSVSMREMLFNPYAQPYSTGAGGISSKSKYSGGGGGGGANADGGQATGGVDNGGSGGGGGGGFFGCGGNSTFPGTSGSGSGGGGGGGFFGRGGNATSSGGGGGGGFFCDGGNATSPCGGGGGGFFCDGEASTSTTSGTTVTHRAGAGGNGGVLIIYHKEESDE